MRVPKHIFTRSPLTNKLCARRDRWCLLMVAVSEIVTARHLKKWKYYFSPLHILIFHSMDRDNMFCIKLPSWSSFLKMKDWYRIYTFQINDVWSRVILVHDFCFHWGGTDPVIDVQRRFLTWFLNLTVSVVFVIYIFFFDSKKSVQHVSKHRYFPLACYVKGISAKTLTSKEV